LIDKVLFSSVTEEWITPKRLYDQLDEEFHFDLDPCTIEENPLGTRNYFTIVDDGLEQKWFGNVFVNPPYNTEINEWLYKADQELQHNSLVKNIVFLLPVRSDTRWFHKYIYDDETNQFRRGVKIRFIKGRLKFGNARNAAPFPSMIVIFSKNVAG
jgi:phage N-6-adenine-methyltransferase